MMVYFHEHLVPYLTSIDNVSQYPGNPNEGDIDSVIESMQVNGVYEGILAQRSTGYILAGNHRYAALLALESEQIPVRWLDVDHTEAKRILTVDNRTTRLGRDNPADLLKILEDLQHTEAGLIGTGYTEVDLDIIASQMAEGDHFFAPGNDLASTYQVVIDCPTEARADDIAAQIREELTEQIRVVAL